jgi:hypothetical protein
MMKNFSSNVKYKEDLESIVRYKLKQISIPDFVKNDNLTVPKA